MTSTPVVGVYREPLYSPGKVRADGAILDATLARLSSASVATTALEPAELEAFSSRPELVLSMAQSEKTLHLLEGWEREGTRVINTVRSNRNCHRKTLVDLLMKARLPIPEGEVVPLEDVEKRVFPGASQAYWLKRGDVHAIQPSDVVKVTKREEMVQVLDRFGSEGIKEVLLQEHREGDVVKLYGVGRGALFRAFHAATGEDVTSEMASLSRLAQESAEVVGLEIYGGDAVVTPGDGIVLIDLNDWPTFSPCREAAARKIAEHVIRNHIPIRGIGLG